MRTAKLSSKSQIVIPVAVRRELGLEPGDHLEVEVQGDSIVLRKQIGSWVERLDRFSGKMWRGYADEVRRERSQWDRRV